MVDSVTYRFLRLAEVGQQQFASVRAAFDRACEDLVSESAAPLEITSGDRTILTLGDICELADHWLAYRADGGPHPLQGIDS